VIGIVAVIMTVVSIVSVGLPIGLWNGITPIIYNRIYETHATDNLCYSSNNVNQYQTPFNFSVAFYEMNRQNHAIEDRECSSVFSSNGVNTFNVSQYHLNETFGSQVWSVNFLARNSKGGVLDAWLLSRDNFTSLPTAIVVHDMRGCKRQHQALLPASMLFHSGFNVMLLDLRNHGESYFESSNPYVRFGDDEFRDILGAVDYLNNVYGGNESVEKRLVLFGVGMGASAALIAYEREPLFKALYVDSPICNTFDTIVHGLKASLGPLARSMSKGGCIQHGNAKGCAPFHNDPLKSAKKLVGRPVFFEHNVHDSVVPISNSRDCLLGAQEANGIPFDPNANESNQTIVEYHFTSNSRLKKCRNHATVMLTETEDYKKRMVDFFSKYV